MIPVAASFDFGSLANLSFTVVLLWSYALLPHLWMVRAPLSVSSMVAIALVEYAVVGLVVGRLTVGKRLAQTLLVVGLSLIVVGALTHLALRALGYRIVAGGP
jgi:hypothetical protein